MQSVPTINTVVLSANNEPKQVPLRDYLNIRIAPFLKQAITKSLDAQAEYPLQWLGEYLIQQSILFEGNPDSTNIKERFIYKFENPVPAPQAPNSFTENTTNGVSASDHPETHKMQEDTQTTRVLDGESHGPGSVRESMEVDQTSQVAGDTEMTETS